MVGGKEEVQVAVPVIHKRRPLSSPSLSSPCRSQALLGNASRQALLGASPTGTNPPIPSSAANPVVPLSFPSAAWECVPRSAASPDSPPTASGESNGNPPL